MTKGRKAVFLDRDGTLNKDEGYVHKIEDFELYDDVIPSLKKLKEFHLFIVSNQSGVGRGKYTEEQMHAFNAHMLSVLKKEGIHFTQVYACTHAPEEQCSCRKPGQEFLNHAVKEHGIDPKQSWMIGDHGSDVIFGKKAGMRSILLLTGHGLHHFEENRNSYPEYTAATLAQAVHFLLSEGQQKVIERTQIGAVAEKEREKGKSIVTLNGTFDILHPGHTKIIQEAKKQGDILILAINSDSSVRKNKGPQRPINTQHARALMLASFSEIDYVTIFEEQTPIALLEEIKPNVHVNGSEYGAECIEADTVKKHGGRIHVVTLLPGHSTTKLIGG